MKHINLSKKKRSELVLIDNASTTVSYFGFAEIGTLTSENLWKIKKMTISGNVTTFNFADGNDNYDNIWDNRASLSYS